MILLLCFQLFFGGGGGGGGVFLFSVCETSRVCCNLAEGVQLYSVQLQQRGTVVGVGN